MREPVSIFSTGLGKDEQCHQVFSTQKKSKRRTRREEGSKEFQVRTDCEMGIEEDVFPFRALQKGQIQEVVHSFNK
jgi:hypothetical protein